MRWTLPVTIWLMFMAVRAAAQPDAQAPEFEVASVKPAEVKNSKLLLNMPSNVAMMIGFEGGPGSKDPGRINYHEVTLKLLLAHAYGFKPEQISGPDWINSERYTIIAKLAPSSTADQLRMMLQKLLTERFQITLHQELKEMSVYQLKVAKNGPKLSPPEIIPQHQTDEERIAANQKRAEAMMARMKARQEESARTGIRYPSRSFSLQSATLERFTEMLSSYVDRPVKNMTELKGNYSFRLEWSPDAVVNNGEALGPNLFSALQEQLGLRLEPTKDRIELLVIDKAVKVPISN
jgi:uncharacterized protein (TIGR03435 family)